MKNIARLLQVATLAVLAVVVSKPAAAQQLDSYRFGYQFAHIGDGGGNVPVGFYGDVSGKLGPSIPMLDWVGQVTFGHKSDSSGTVSVSSNLFTVGGGVRYAIDTKNADFKPHVQGLVLIARSSSGDVTVNGVNFSGGSSTDLGVELSAAVDHPMANGWMVTGGVGFQRIMASSGENVLIVRVGVAHKIGK